MIGKVARFAVQATACAFGIASGILRALALDGFESQGRVYRVLMTDEAVQGVLGTQEWILACARQLARQSGKDVVVLKTADVVMAPATTETVDRVLSQN